VPIPVTEQSKAWVCSISLTGIMGSNLAGSMDVSLVNIVLCQVVSTSGSSLVQRSPTKYGGFGCDREVSIMTTPLSTRGCCATEKNVCEIIT
jgi:hypothetical protein